MSFLIDCPNCRSRPGGEFHYGGELRSRPAADADDADWTDYVYNRTNTRGVTFEWWYHRSACKCWFVVERDTRTNRVLSTHRPDAVVEDGGA